MVMWKRVGAAVAALACVLQVAAGASAAAGGAGRLAGPSKAPEQIHLAFGHKSSEMTVSWVTEANGTAAVVMYGESPDALVETGRGEAAVYSAKMVPKYSRDGFVDYVSGLIHHVTLQGLKPSTMYFYKAGDPAADFSAVYNFTSRPADGDLSAPTTFSIVGDMGQTLNSASTLEHMMADDSAIAILHAGDMSYADCQGSRWDSWANLVQPLAAHKAWMVSAGNHEIEPDGTGKIMAGYKARFRMPEVKPTEDTTQYFQNPSDDGYDCTPSAFTGNFNYGNSFYSLNIGPAHVVFLNSYTETDPSSAQFQWLEADLAAVDTSVTPWILAVWHSPWYNSNHAHFDEFNTVAMRAAMEPVLHKYGVAVAFNGHVHAYERSFPVYRNETALDGTVYIGIGDGGNREGLADSWHTTPPYSAFHSGGYYGHGTLRIVNETQAEWAWHRNVDNEWVVADATKIANPRKQ